MFTLLCLMLSSFFSNHEKTLTVENQSLVNALLMGSRTFEIQIGSFMDIKTVGLDLQLY